ncbi:MAG: hypothetical protein J0L93_01405 [Deltaproteobacteria bacterium]|nr:hypothetical protein [Deltaproteobacteria bacterium]
MALKGKGSSKKRQPEKKGGDHLDILSESNETRAVISKSNQIVICKNPGCHDIATTLSFCRFHYLSSWRKLKTKEAKKKGQELKIYLKDMGRKFPEEFLEKLKAEIEDMSEKEAAGESSDDDKGLFDQMDGEEDLDTIIKGLKVEDF